MSETAMVAKMILVLGILFIFVAALFPGQETAWTTFQAGVSGTTFPTFDNPFSEHAYRIPMIPDANATVSDFASVTGCASATYWECLASNDGNTSYVTLNASHTFVNSHTENLSGAGLNIISITLTISCRTTGTAPWNNWHFDGGLSEKVIAECPEGPNFSRQIVNFVQVQSYAWDGLIGCAVGASLCDAINSGFSGVTLDAGNTTGTADVSYLELDAYVIQASSCNNGNAFTTTGCQIGKVVDTIIKFGQFLFNGVIFVGAIFVYLTSTALGIVSGFFSIASLLFAVPGAPPFAQNIFSAVVTSFIVVVLLVFVKILRGIGGGA